jgi:hypothetical protein
MSLRSWFMSFQQHLMRRVWKPPVMKQEDDIYMIIRGKILTAVRLSDIRKVVECGKEVFLTEFEAKSSRDLKNAISRNWVEVVYNKTVAKKTIATQESSQNISQNEIVNIAKTMAQTMAEEMIRNSPLVKEIAKELAKEMVTEIKDNIKIEQLNVPHTSGKDIKIDSSSETIFIDFKDEEAGITANMSNIGIEKQEKSDLTSSLEKIKKLKKDNKI